MKINNLEVGKTYKNYKELCGALGIEPKRGNSKNSQLKAIDMWVNYTKVGHRFTIEEVLEVPRQMEDGRSNGNNSVPYIPFLEKLILDMLLQSPKDKPLVLSKTQMFKNLKMVNNNYSLGKKDPISLSHAIETDYRITTDWYNSTDAMLEGNVVKALNSLEAKALVVWNKVTTINVDIEGDEFKGQTEYREATDEEDLIISASEHEVLEKMDCEHKGIVVMEKKWDEFQSRVISLTRQRGGINFYYKSYKILFHKNIVQKRVDKLNSELQIDEAMREELQGSLNDSIQARVVSNATKRQERVSSYFGKPKSHRSLPEYIPQTDKLNKTLLHREAKSIHREIQEQRIKRQRSKKR